MTIDESNWLDSKVIECQNCGQKLHWLWHSPMYDETFFYCTQCPKRVEVSRYDGVVLSLRKLAIEKQRRPAIRNGAAASICSLRTSWQIVSAGDASNMTHPEDVCGVSQY
jgi:hypothetical protein